MLINVLLILTLLSNCSGGSNNDYFPHPSHEYNERRQQKQHRQPYEKQIFSSVSALPSKLPDAVDAKLEPKVFFKEPIIIKHDGTMVLISLSPLNDSAIPTSTENSEYYVIVKKMGRPFPHAINLKLNYSSSLLFPSSYYVVYMFSLAKGPFITKFWIGNGKTFGDYENPPLEFKEEYRFVVLAKIPGLQVAYYTESKSIKVDSDPQVFQIIIIVILSILLVITLVILAILIYINYTGDEKLQSLLTFWSKGDQNSSSVPTQGRERRYLLRDEYDEEGMNEAAFIERGVDLKTHPIPISELSDYYERMLQSDGFKAEYLTIYRGQSANWETGKKMENKTKNRYGNLMAYEHSRVKLTVEVDDELTGVESISPPTDYINANWIDGYNLQAKRYIATQGPMNCTVVDFWRMIWQTESRILVMLTNLEEIGRVKCDKYWPGNSPEKYGAFRVTLIKTELFADYVIRKLIVEKAGISREIIHYHFISWPDHAVPIYSCSLISFLRKLRAHPTYDHKNWPIIVHCSAGVGRTGTLILADSMFEMAAVEKHVDILKYLCVARKGRINMVEKLSQYIFVHQLLAEALCNEQTDINCNQLDNYLVRLKYTDPNTRTSCIEQQYQTLNKLTQHFSAELCSAALANSNMNRSADVIPPNFARVMLDTSSENGNDYLNAVYVNGYKRRDAYIATEIPLAHVREAFWTMVQQIGVKTIVLLNEVSSEDMYWPYEVNSSQKYGQIDVRLIREEHLGFLTLRSFQIADGQLVKQFHLRSWSSTAKLPREAQQIVDLLERVEKFQVESSSSKVIVQCLNGARATGVYCSASFVCDRIKEEHQVDVFLAARTTRIQRPQFIESIEQYNFLYELARSYLENFEIYANFK